MSLLRKSFIGLVILVIFMPIFGYGIYHFQPDIIKNISNSYDESISKNVINSIVKNNTKNNSSQNKINDHVLSKLDSYLLEISKLTNFEFSDVQKNLLINSINTTPIYNLPLSITASHRKNFDKVRKSLLMEWQKNTNQKWPTYEKNVVINGKTLRYKGQNYDAHHIIELSWNGPNEWWNLTPASYPDQHQEGIHAAGSIASKLFSKYSVE